MAQTQDINFEDLTSLLKDHYANDFVFMKIIKLQGKEKNTCFNAVSAFQASNKQQVIELCQKAFENSGKEDIPNNEVANTAEMLSLENSQNAKGLLLSLGKLIKVVLFNGASTVESISALFPTDFHKNLRELLSKILADNFSVWRTATVSNSVSLPKLVDFDWRVDLKMASGKVARMNAPTCILHLKIDDPSRPVHGEERLQTYNVELSKETLDTMLNGLGRIRDQLSAVAKK